REKRRCQQIDPLRAANLVDRRTGKQCNDDENHTHPRPPPQCARGRRTRLGALGKPLQCEPCPSSQESLRRTAFADPLGSSAAPPEAVRNPPHTLPGGSSFA